MNQDERLDVVIVGGGVVGLAIARAFALMGREAVLVEAETATGTHTSARNSEVIHSGIYYPAGSLKARLCVTGRQLLYDYCLERNVAFARPGKLIVATNASELAVLKLLEAKGKANGVDDLRWMDGAEVSALEPALRCAGGLFSPSTGIVDSHALMAALRGDAESGGARVLLASPMLGGQVRTNAIDLSIGGSEPTVVSCRAVVNAAGLWAQQVAGTMSGLPPETIPPSFLAKGHYFGLAGPPPFRHLVYPVPAPGGLGVHVTLDLAGQVRFGPDVSWLEAVDYRFDEGRADSFYAAIRAYYPGLKDGQLQPGYTGIRPKLGPEGSPAQDFVIQGPADHGVPGLVNLYGIESPGLTASLAIANQVAALLT